MADQKSISSTQNFPLPEHNKTTSTKWVPTHNHNK